MKVAARHTSWFVVSVLVAVVFFMAGFLLRDNWDERGVSADNNSLMLFQEAWGKINSDFLGELPTQKQVNYGAIQGALHQLNDPYTLFLEPVVREEERENLRGNFGGIGVYLTQDAEKQYLIEVIPNNPAEKAGVRTGDILLGIDGKLLTKEDLYESVSDRIRGEKGTFVRLTIRHPDSAESVEISIERGDILIPSVAAKLLPQDSTIGYIQLNRFSGESGVEVGDAADQLLKQGATRFILDLRDNGGGLVNAAVDVCNHFLDQKIVYYQQSRGEKESNATTKRNPILSNQPLIVLVNGNTASAAEIVAGALQDHQRAILIGEQTFGKGSVQRVYDLSDGSSIHVTWARWFTPNHRQIDKNGLMPDIEQPNSAEDSADAQLERAILYLQTEQSVEK